MGIKVGGHMNDDNNQDDINQVPASSPNFKTDLAKKLQELAPEVITDGKVDTKKLKELLDEDTADDSERFGLFWPGKKRAMRAAQEPTTATLKPAKEESKDWDTTQNIFIEGDNLEVLKILQKHYHNKIKMIYIDPPYNTGKDFVYPDNYKEGLQSYLEFTKQVNEEGKKVSTNSDTDGRYHSNWLNMMYPRLKLARNLLTDDGVIFISIDDNEQTNLKLLCDEIFGVENFVALLVWKSRLGKGSTSTQFAVTHEYILCYARNSQNLDLNQDVRVSEKDSLERIRQWGQGDRKEDRPTMYYPVKIEGQEIYPIRDDGSPGRWRIGKEKMLELIDAGLVTIGQGKGGQKEIYKIKPSGNVTSTAHGSLLDGELVKTTAHGSKEIKILFSDMPYVFDYPKPTTLISFLASLVKEKDYTILDFFSGSGTTADAVMRLNAEDSGNRRHIQVQLPEETNGESQAFKYGFKNIADVSKERIRRAGEKIKQDFAEEIAKRKQPLDVGFKVFKLADTNFAKWQTSSDVDIDSVQQRFLDMRDSSNDDASQEDLLTEILVKLGLPLTVKVNEDNIEGLKVWNVSDKAVVAYLDEHTKPSLDQLRAIADSDPGKIVILEDCFQGDDELKTNLSQICKSKDIELWTV